MNVETSDQIVTVDFRVQDETGINYMGISFEDEPDADVTTLPNLNVTIDGSISYAWYESSGDENRMQRISGDAQDGYYRGEFTVPQGANNNDDYRIRLYVTDANDIAENYYSAQKYPSERLASLNDEQLYLSVVGGGEEADFASFAGQIPQLINISTSKITPSINLD